MKNHFLLYLLALVGLFMVSCDDDGEDDKTVSNLEITADASGNKVVVSATADNAVSFSWDFANGNTANGPTAEAEYLIGGKYWIKCTATGLTSKLTDSVEVEVDGKPGVDNKVARLLCGYDETTGESTAVWYWAARDMALSGGYKSFSYQHDSSMYSLFDPIDQSWWNEAGPSLGESYNDAYSFKFNPTFDYLCDYKEDGFGCNWAYAYYRYNMSVSQYADVALSTAPTAGNWEIMVVDYAEYTDYEPVANAPKTMVDGVAEDKAYLLKINNGAYLMQENAIAEYQILSISEDEIFLRWETGLPGDFDVDAGWDYPEWLSPGDGEWQYAYLVKTESAPAN